MRWISLYSSVGTQTSKNSKRDVKIAQSLLNVYLRKENKTPLRVSGSFNNEINQVILEYQSSHLKMKKPDGRIDPGGRTYRSLIEGLTKSYTIKPVIPPSFGIVTWQSEGSEGGIYHSRKLHVPNSSSGLTIGRGYDFRRKEATTIVSDLTLAGVKSNYAQTLKKASGLHGDSAKKFIIDNDLLDFEISPEVQKKLFMKIYEYEAKEVKRICSKKLVEEEYGKTDWNNLYTSIKEITIDLKFRGDYTPNSRKFLQKTIAKNSLDQFKEQIISKSNWVNVPQDRFLRRKKYIENAAISGKDQKAAK